MRANFHLSPLLGAGLFAALTSVTSPAGATAFAEEAAKLGKEFTPVGATAAGNADGSIGAWENGAMFDIEMKAMTPQKLEDLRAQFEAARAKNPAPFEDLRKYIDTFNSVAQSDEIQKKVDGIIASLPPDQQKLANDQRKQIGGGGKYEKPTVIITKANMNQFADKLTAGHKAMFAAYPDYKMIVYPSYRTAFYPQKIYEETIKNATRAHLEGTDGVKGAVLGFPFPIPKSGAEVLWNHKLKFRGSGVRRYNNQAIVKPDGSYKITKIVEDVKFKYANLAQPGGTDAGVKLLAYYLQEVLSPPRVAGQLTLVHETADQTTGGRAAWIYNPGLARINRAPDVGYDNPSVGTDGEQFNDQIDVFNGALDRYDWKLVGKKEMYVAYNSFLINTPLIKYKDIIRPGHINQNLARYELHRVWVVDATVKSGVRHNFKRRTFYVDEDSWSIAAVDCYDNRDQLWKVQEAHLITAPFVPTVTGIPEVIYDLQSHRYFTTAMLNEDKISDFKINFEDEYFSPANIKRKASTR